ncbi:MAG: carbon storage regulator [Planctomycetota bacterium]|nr:carbon storage regulator [Planctomycetota bacterium]
MLALSRLVGERILIGEDIVIEVRKITGSRVVIAVGAPDDVVIDREEVFERKLDDDQRYEMCETPQQDRRIRQEREDVRETEASYGNRLFRLL